MKFELVGPIANVEVIAGVRVSGSARTSARPMVKAGGER